MKTNEMSFAKTNEMSFAKTNEMRRNPAHKFLHALGLAVAFLAASSTAYANVAGHVQFVSGDVQITGQAGQIRPAQKGDAINEGDTLTSAQKSSAQIKMQDGGFVAVRPDTKLKFDEFAFAGKEDGSEKSFFSLFKGGFRAVTGLIGRLNKQNYRITTPAATIGIRGTDHETFVITPGSLLAQIAPLGAYNKVNVGETSVTTDRGTINVQPNQMGFAGGMDKMPKVQPINSKLFTVAEAPAPEAKAVKKEEKKEEKAEDSKQAGGAGEGTAAEAETTTEGGSTGESAQGTATATAPQEETVAPVRETAVVDATAPSTGGAPAATAPTVTTTTTVVAAPPPPTPTTVINTASVAGGSTANIVTGTVTTSTGQIATVADGLYATQALVAADAAAAAAVAAQAAATAAATDNTTLAAISLVSTVPATTAIGTANASISGASASVTSATALTPADATTATSNATTASNTATIAASQAAAAQAAFTANGTFADSTAGSANNTVQSANTAAQSAKDTVLAAATNVTTQNTALTTAQSAASTALSSANTNLGAANTSLTTANTQNTAIATAQGAITTQVTVAQTAAANAQAAATAAQAAATQAATLQAAGDLAGAQAQLLVAQQELTYAQAQLAIAQAAQTAVSTQLANALAAATAASTAVTTATASAGTASTDAATAQTQAAAAQTASSTATAALTTSTTNLATVNSNAATVATNAMIAAYNNPAVTGGNFFAHAEFPIAVAGGFNVGSDPDNPLQLNTTYVLDGSGNLVEARNMHFQVQANQKGNVLTPVITGASGANIKWSGGTAADTFKLTDNSIYAGRWMNATVTVTDNAVPANVYTYTPAASLWAVLLPPPSGYVPSLVGATTYAIAGNTAPVDAFGNLGVLNSASLVADFTSQLVDAAVNLTMSTGSMAGTFNVSGATIPIDALGGFDVSNAGALTTTCTTGACAAGAGGYSADMGGSFAGTAAASVGMTYNIWPTTATSADPATNSVQGLVAFTTATAPTVNPTGPLAAYVATNTSVAHTGAYGGNNFIAAPGEISPAGNPTTFIESYGDGLGSRSDILTGATTATPPTTTANGITFGVWETFTSVDSSEQHRIEPGSGGLPVHMYGEDGYLDSAYWNGTSVTGAMANTFNYTSVATTSFESDTWATGSVTTATMSADFTAQTVNVALAGTMGTNNWALNSTNLPINFSNPTNGAGAQFFDDLPTLTLNSASCPTCDGHIGGAFVGQNYAGAIVQYGFYDNNPVQGMNAGGLVAFSQNTPVTPGAPAPTGAFAVADAWQIASQTAITTNGSNVLTGWSSPGFSSTVAPAAGSGATVFSSANLVITRGTWAAGSIGASTFSYNPTWAAGSIGASTFSYNQGPGQFHWITAPEPTPVYLAEVLTTTNAVYNYVDGDVTSLTSGVHGTVSGTTLITADFTMQTVAANLDLVVNGHNWAASTTNAPLQSLNNSSMTGFSADSYRMPFEPGYLTVTVDGTTANGNLAGQLVGAALDGAFIKFNLNEQVTTPTQGYEWVQGVAALGAAVANNPATPYRIVGTSMSDPMALVPTVMVGGAYNNEARVMTDVSGNLTKFDDNFGGGSGFTIQHVSGAFVDQGSVTIGSDTISWGRWDAGTVATVTDRATGSSQNVTLTGGAHAVVGPIMTGPVALPVNGSYTYNKIGNTLPTDDAGVAGTLNSATLSANFTAQTVDVGLNVTAGGATLNAAATSVPIQQRATFFTNSKMTGPGALAVTCTAGACGTTNHGAIGGGFGGAGGALAAITYGFEKGGTNAGTVSGVAVFQR